MRSSTTKNSAGNKNIGSYLKQLVLSGNWGKDEIFSDSEDMPIR